MRNFTLRKGSLGSKCGTQLFKGLYYACCYDAHDCK